MVRRRRPCVDDVTVDLAELSDESGCRQVVSDFRLPSLSPTLTWSTSTGRPVARYARPLYRQQHLLDRPFRRRDFRRTGCSAIGCIADVSPRRYHPYTVIDFTSVVTG